VTTWNSYHRLFSANASLTAAGFSNKLETELFARAYEEHLQQPGLTARGKNCRFLLYYIVCFVFYTPWGRYGVCKTVYLGNVDNCQFDNCHLTEM